jgi:hypothetical protein
LIGLGNFPVKSNCLKSFLLLLTSILYLSANAQMVRQPLTIKYAGLGAYSKNFVDVFSATSNQAALAKIKSGGVGVYGERRFMLAELNQYSGIVALPTSKSGTFALQGDYFGDAGYNENQLGIAYGRSVAKQVDIGLKINYHTVRIAGYGSASAVNFEAGTVFHVTEQLHAGFHVYNPLNSKLGKTSNEKLASIYKMGLGYEASDKVFLSAEIEKQENREVGVNAGLQYNVHEKVFVRAGISTASSNSYAGVGLHFGQFRLDINAGYHPQLGFTPGLLLLINFKKPA